VPIKVLSTPVFWVTCFFYEIGLCVSVMERSDDHTRGLCGREQAQTDVSSWRQKYDAAAAAAEAEEAEDMSSKRRKQMLTARMSEYEAQLASAVAKTAALEKIKNQLQLDSESLVAQLDKVDIHSLHTCKANSNSFRKTSSSNFV